MGFWHTGYLEFHEPTADPDLVSWEPMPPSYPCMVCGVEFATEADRHVHTFEGHPTQQPVLVLNGRECGRRRLTITYRTQSTDWVIKNADTAWVNNQATSVVDAVQRLVESRAGIIDVTLGNGKVVSDFQFEFALAEMQDLEGVDSVLEDLIRGADLSAESIDTFIMRAKRYATAGRYCTALADYLYGVVIRESDTSDRHVHFPLDRGAYADRFDSAVNILGTFDRPPAEAICGIVAFHYNQFAHAMTKTRSQRVAHASMRFEELLRGGHCNRGGLAPVQHGRLDHALSDGSMEQVLRWSSMPIDGTAPSSVVEGLVESLDRQHPLDQLKLHLVAAEHFLSAGDRRSAAEHADSIRYGPTAHWYTEFRSRLERGIEQ